MIITGAKKSDGSSGQESANTLKSNTVVNIVEALGEGVISGLVDGARSIYFDQTPLANLDGSLNFKGVTWEPRYGLPSQDPMAGTTQTATPHTVEAQVKVSTGPIVRTINDGRVNGVNVVVRIPALAYSNKETGDITGASVSWVIERRESGGSWEIAKRIDIYGQKCTSPYPKSSYVEAPTNFADPWDIRVRRITADSTTLELQNDTFWESYSTIVKGQYTYDDTALIRLNIDASQFGSSIGARSYHVRGLIIDTPSNYDPTTRTYSGVWDGTFVRRWTNNPAWIFYDLVTNSRYGVGEFVSASLIDKWSLYQIGRYCDQLVPSGFNRPDGSAIMEPRFVFNGVIATRQEAYKALQDITAAFRGMAYWSLGQVFCSADMPADPVAGLTPANVINGHFKYSGTSMKARHSVAVVTWNDPADFYRPTPEYYQSDTQMARFGYRAVEVSLLGCTSRGQAHRFAKWIVDTEETETETVQFTMSWDGYVLENNSTLRPGQIILISDPRKNGNYRAGGRLAISASTTSLTLDQLFEPAPGTTYTLSTMMPNGAFETKTIDTFGSDNKTLTMGEAFSDVPVSNADWIIQSVNFQARRYRVMSVQEQDKHLFTITALAHDPNKYERVENNLALEPIKYVRPRNTVNQVTNVDAVEAHYFQSGVSHSRVGLSWTAPNDYLVQDFMVTADTPRGFQSFPSTTFPSMDFTDAAPGPWKFYISARSVSGLISAPVTFEFTVAGWEAVDGPIPDSLRTTDGGTTFAGRAPTIVWSNVFPLDAVVYPVENVVRVYDAVTNVLLRTENTLQEAYTYTYESNVNDGGPRRTIRVDVTAKAVAGIESAPASITVTNPVSAAITPTLRADVGSIDISWLNTDNDYAGALVWVSNNAGFTPNLSNFTYDGPDTKTVAFVTGSGLFYVWVAVYDAFGKVGINVSARQSITVNDLTSTIAGVLPDLIGAVTDVVTNADFANASEDIHDQIAGILSQVVADRDDNDLYHKRAVQQLSVKTDGISALVASEQTARVEADFAEATARQILEVTINTNVIAAIASETAARVSADSALTTQINSALSQIATNVAAISSEATTRASADTAQTTQINTALSQIGTNDTAVRALITSEASTRTTADSSLTSQIATAVSTIGSNDTAVRALITSEASTRSTADSAIASSVSTLSTTVGGNTADITTVNSSVNGVKVQFGAIGTINGVTGGFLFTGIRKLDGSVSYAVEIGGNLIVDGTITATKLSVTSLSAISVNAGEITAGIIRSANSKFIINLNNQYELISD